MKLFPSHEEKKECTLKMASDGGFRCVAAWLQVDGVEILQLFIW